MNGNTKRSSKTGKLKILRIPRPYGSTALAAQYHISKDPEVKQQFIDMMVNQWLLGNMVLCGHRYDIGTFASSLGITIDDIRVKMRDQVMNSRIWDKEAQEQIVTGLMGTMMSWTIEDRMRVNNQIELLMDSQQGRYTPFISAEVNKALKMGIDSTASMQALVQKFIGGSGTTNIFNMFQQNNNQEVNNQFVTQAQVLEILTQEDKILDKSQEAKLLETKYDIGSLPEVVAVNQNGGLKDRESLGETINYVEMNNSLENLKEAVRHSEKDHHEMRREIEMRIDSEADDPELDTYEEIEDHLPEEPEEFSAQNFLQ